MFETLRRLALGLVLIAGASALLLFSDLGSRTAGVKKTEPAAAERVAKVAILQHASQSILDTGREGMMAGLAERGWVQGRNLEVKRYNAEGDMPTGQAIAQTMASGGNDLLLTISTPSLQAVANANKTTQTPHVFGLVADPVAAGVGVSKDNPLDHPAWLAGFGTMQPVKRAFEIARLMNPALKSVGIVWNAGEANSEAQVKLARKICAGMGIDLVEVTVENSAGVAEAAAALTSRGVEAIWVNGDVSVITSIDAVVAAGRKAGIPVFTVIPPNAKRGALFDFGADYYEVGRLAGVLAGDILNGTKPSTVPITNVMPEIQTINLQALQGLKGHWTVPEDLQKRAQLLIDENGVAHDRSTPRPTPAPVAPTARAGETYRVGIAYFAEEPSRTLCEKGLLEGLRDLGFVEGKNLTVTRNNAQADMSNISTVIQNFAASANDAIVTFSTPVLQGALANADQKPVVFTYVTDPIAAGAGLSYTDHLPNVTGIGTLPPVDEAVRTLRRVIPKLKTLGTLYNNGEANSVKVISLLREACKNQGIELAEVPAANTGDVMQAAQALAARKVDAIYLTSDNTAMQALDGIMETAAKAGIPVVNDDPDYFDRGMLLTVGPGFYHSGKAAAPLLARVLTGESPAGIPMENVSVNSTKFSAEVAKKLGIEVPEGVAQQITAAPAAAKPSAAKPNPSGKTWKIAIVLYNETPPAEEILHGMADGWKASPLKEGRDYTIKIRSAQGDMGALSGIFDAALTENADLIVPLSTPSLQSAIRKVKDRPVVFSLIANPIAAGAGKSYEDHLPNVTGVAVLGPFGEMLDILQKYYPSYKRIGTLFCPAEVNSVDLRDALAAACKKRGFTLEAVAANSPGEFPDAAMALASRPIDAIVQISDNLSNAGFSALTKAARQAQKPLFSLNSTTVPQGSPVSLGRDYHDAGVATIGMIEKVIAGQDPATIPFILPPKTLRVISLPNARALGMKIPEGLIKQADKVIE